MWPENSFITLTYDEEHAPWDGSLNKVHFQKFIRRLRKSEPNKTIRYFHVGEYGAELQRPHYHALIFNHDFNQDKYLWSQKEGINLYRSDKLEKLWPFGFSTVGDLTWETAAYCSRYCLKKITGKEAEEHYTKVSTETGELIRLEPEYITMSLKPAIGKSWYETYKTDCYPSDFITHRGKKYTIPKYYDKLYQEENEAAFTKIKERRIQKACTHMQDQTKQRLRDRETCQEARAQSLKRHLELQ